jgi:uncharacterized membrane protein YeiH
MEILFDIIEIVGLISFSISGTMIAIDKETDIFGVVFLSIMTVFGGGFIRDVVLNTTPIFFTSYIEVAIAFTTTIITFVVAYINRKGFKENEPKVRNINNFFDALGLFQ